MAKGDLDGYKRGDMKSNTRSLVSQFHAEEEAAILELGALEEEMSDDGSDDFRSFDRCDSRQADDTASGEDYYDDGFDYYIPRQPVVLMENSWRDGDCFDPMDQGVGYLRYLMESVRPAEIAGKDIPWVVSKHLLISATVLAGLLSQEYFKSDKSLLLGRYVAALEIALGKAGIEFKTFGGLTEKGWETFRAQMAVRT